MHTTFIINNALKSNKIDYFNNQLFKNNIHIRTRWRLLIFDAVALLIHYFRNIY